MSDCKCSFVVLAVLSSLLVLAHGGGSSLSKPWTEFNMTGRLQEGLVFCKIMKIPSDMSFYDCAQAYVFGHWRNVHQSKGAAQLHVIMLAMNLQKMNTEDPAVWARTRVAEIGCGALHLAKELIPRLSPSSYVCVEPNSWLNVAALHHDPDFLALALEKRPVFLKRTDFRPVLDEVGESCRQKFQMVFSHSILSHAPKSLLDDWLRSVSGILSADGIAVASLYHHDVETGSYDVEDSNHTVWEYPGVTILTRTTVAAAAKAAGLEMFADTAHAAQVRLWYWERTSETHDWVFFRWPQTQSS